MLSRKVDECKPLPSIHAATRSGLVSGVPKKTTWPASSRSICHRRRSSASSQESCVQGLTLVHFSAKRKRFL
jgi:hypothetical protein